jgi:single-strand DNA-binding protein
MTDINQLVATGRLVRDPIIRRAATGTMVAVFTVATNHYYRAKNGEFEEEAAFIPCIAFSRTAEVLSHRMKGEPILVVGRLRTDAWEQDSARRTQLTLVCDSVRCFAAPVGSSNALDESAKNSGTDAMPQEIKNSVPF